MINSTLKKQANTLILGMPGIGKSCAQKLMLADEIITEYIVNSHLNNNNWLKMHNKPMIRKGHPLYKQIKRLKNVSHYDVVIAEPYFSMMGLEKYYHNITPNEFNAVIEKAINNDKGILHKQEILAIIKR